MKRRMKKVGIRESAPVSSSEAWDRFERLSERISKQAARKSAVTELRNMRR
jgi:hypothetical protein